MLPDWPKLKAELGERMREFLDARVDHYLGPIGKVPHVRFFEGNRSQIERPSGQIESSDYAEMRSELVLEHAAIPSLTPEALLRKLDETAKDMARQMGEHFFKTLSDSLDRAGNVVDAKGAPLNAETLLSALSTMQISFELDGTPRMPEMFISPALSEAAHLAQKKLNEDPDLKAQLAKIIDRQREDWRAREASRNLVG